MFSLVSLLVVFMFIAGSAPFVKDRTIRVLPYITHGVICTIVIEDHGLLVGTLKGLVALASACEAFEGTCLDSLIGWGSG